MILDLPTSCKQILTCIYSKLKRNSIPLTVKNLKTLFPNCRSKKNLKLLELTLESQILYLNILAFKLVLIHYIPSEYIPLDIIKVRLFCLLFNMVNFSKPMCPISLFQMQGDTLTR